MFLLLTAALAGTPGVAWTSPNPHPIGAEGLVSADLDGAPPLDVAAIQQAPGGAALELFLRPANVSVRINLEVPSPASLLAANLDGDATDELVVGAPDASDAPGTPPIGIVTILWDPSSYADLSRVSDGVTTRVPGEPRSSLGDSLAAVDLDGVPPIDLMITAPTEARSGAIYGLTSFQVGVTQAKAGGRWVFDTTTQGIYTRIGEALTTKTGFGLTLACIGPLPTECKERTLVALDLTHFAPASDLLVGIAAITNTPELLTGAEELTWRDDLDGDGAIDPVLTGGTYALVGPSTPPGWPGDGPAVRAGGFARRGDHLLLATGDAVLEMADLVADLNAAIDTWASPGASRLLPVDDWDGDGCADVLVSGTGAVGLIPGDCPLVDTDVPVDTIDTTDTVTDTDTVVDDTLPADDTGLAPCDPEFGWSCATTDARSALWALGLAALAGRRRRR